MHASSYLAMEHIVSMLPSSRILDIGSFSTAEGSPTYRDIADKLRTPYVGLDVQPGRNVDVVATDPYNFPLESESFDLVISGQAFEHIEFPWLTIMEVARVLKPGGFAVLIAPSSGPEHRYPNDCWRFYPDGMKALAKWAGLTCIHASTAWRETGLFMWGDTIGVFTKGAAKPLDLSGLSKVQVVSMARERYLEAGQLLMRCHRKIGELIAPYFRIRN
jgi:SAM-dependent methyltransferase